MFIDLNVLCGDSSSNELQELKAQAFRLGWAGVALNHVASGALTDRDRCRWTSPESSSPATASAEAIVATRQFMRDLQRRPGGGLGVNGQSSADGTAAAGFTVYSRLTLVTDDAAAASALSERSSVPEVLKSYDFLAVQPLTERVFQLACTSLAVDIIAIDISQRLPYRFKPAMLQAAVKRGVFFEVCLSAALLDTATRRNAFAAAQALARALRGRGIIIASGAQAALQLRGPADVANLGALFGLNGKQAKAAVGTSCAAVLQHSAVRRMYKGVVSIRVKQPQDAGLAIPHAAIHLITGEGLQTMHDAAVGCAQDQPAQPSREPLADAVPNKKRKLAGLTVFSS